MVDLVDNKSHESRIKKRKKESYIGYYDILDILNEQYGWTDHYIYGLRPKHVVKKLRKLLERVKKRSDEVKKSVEKTKKHARYKQEGRDPNRRDLSFVGGLKRAEHELHRDYGKDGIELTDGVIGGKLKFEHTVLEDKK